MKKTILISLILVILLLSGCKDDSVKPEPFETPPDDDSVKPQRVETPPPPEDEWELCLPAESFADYYGKIGLEFEDWMEEWIQLMPSPVDIGSDGDIYNIPLERVGGGEVLTMPVYHYELNGKLYYCELTDRNLDLLFSPIFRWKGKEPTKEDVLNYVDFRLVILGRTGYAQSPITILKEEDYEDHYCETPPSEKKISTVRETYAGPERFLVNWVYYTDKGSRTGYYEVEMLVREDAKIDVLKESDEPFADCGAGGIY